MREKGGEDRQTERERQKENQGRGREIGGWTGSKAGGLAGCQTNE